MLNKKGKRVWTKDLKWCKEMILDNKHVLIIHPTDERPHKYTDEDLYVQYQHGNVLYNTDGMSIAFVFRVVTQYCLYDAIDNSLIMKNTDKLDPNSAKKKINYMHRFTMKHTILKCHKF